MKQLPPKHLLLIAALLAALAAGAWYYTNANDPVEGLPSELPEPQIVPGTKDACEDAGGVWNECASACPPDAEACIQMCVQKCEGIGDGKRVISVYFPNSKREPLNTDCEAVYPVLRAVDDTGAAEALRSLLAGPTEAEKASGFFTSIPEGVALLELKQLRSELKDGPVTAIFSPELDKNIGGSCRVTSIRTQIERTFKDADRKAQAFTIAVKGKSSDEVLQP